MRFAGPFAHTMSRAVWSIICRPHDPGEGTTCWPAPESTANMNTSRVGNLGLSGAEEDALVAFMQTLTDGFTPR